MSTAIDVNAGIQPVRREGVPPQGVGGYDQCWYPVARSDELGPGDAIGREFLNGRVVVYRGESGTARVMSAYCRHLGADLSVGKVLGEDIRCAFHHWKYGPDGACNDIPSGDAVPRRARVYNFPVAEAWGLIWAFNGATPLYELPCFPQPTAELEFLVSEPTTLPRDHWILLTNSYDFQHLKAVHGLNLHSMPEDIRFDDYGAIYQAEFEDPNFGPMQQEHRLFGTNAFYLSGTMAGRPVHTMFCALPVPGNASKTWHITAAARAGTTPEQNQAWLRNAAAFFDNLLVEDMPIMTSIRFCEDTLTASDQALKRYLEYLRRYPRAHPSADFIT